MAKNTKIISFHSPLSQTGQTCIANLVGLSLANNGKYVVILELSRYTGMSVFLNKSLGNLKNDLKTCLIDPTKVKNNIIESKHSKRLFYLSQSTKSTASDLTSYNAANIDLIIDQLVGIFDYVFIDLPSEINDVAVVRVLSNAFTHKIDHHVIVSTENILALKKLNDYDNMIAKSVSNRSEKEKTTLVVNKSKGRYSPLFEPFLIDLPYTDIVNLVNVINVEEFPYLCNEGNILNMGRTKESKEFFSSIDMIAKIIDEEVEGVGISRSVKASKTQRKYNRAGINAAEMKKGFSISNLFGGKSNKPKKPKNKRRPNNKGGLGRGRNKPQGPGYGPQGPQGPHQMNMNTGNPINPNQQGGYNPNIGYNIDQPDDNSGMNFGDNIPKDYR